MPHVTKQLGNEVGIQYQGVTDASSSVSQFPVNGLIVGKFRRGRYDQPMTVNLRNVRALLGHDPENQAYQAVLDALHDGVPSVQVLRVVGGAVHYAYLTLTGMTESISVKINGVEVIESGNSYYDFYDKLFNYGIAVYNTYDTYGCWQLYKIVNTTDNTLNIEFNNAYNYIWGVMKLENQENKTISLFNNNEIGELDLGFTDAKFTLAPNKSNINYISPSMIPNHTSVGSDYLYFQYKNRNNEFIEHEIFINNEKITGNLPNGNFSFNVSDFDELYNLLWVHGADPIFGTHSGTYVFPITLGEFKNIRINMIGITEDEYNDNYLNTYFAKNPKYENGVGVLDFYTYDPFDLEEY